MRSSYTHEHIGSIMTILASKIWTIHSSYTITVRSMIIQHVRSMNHANAGKKHILQHGPLAYK